MSSSLFLLDTKLVGPLLSNPAEPLPEELEQFVRGSGDEGVILVSFGSILGEISDQTISTMADVFSTLPQRVIWKLNTGTVVLTLFPFQHYLISCLLIKLYFRISQHRLLFLLSYEFLNLSLVFLVSLSSYELYFSYK